MFRRPVLATLLLALAVAATGCGANPTTPGQAGGGSDPSTAAAARTTDLPTAPTTTAPTAPAASATESAPAAAARSGPYAGLEQSRTPEGYQVLGSANAPVTFVMYSDFF